MFAVVGLGNPGPKYEATRHNAGFWVLDALADKLASGSTWSTRDHCLCCKVHIADEPVLLIKPQKYMNLSGEALWPVLQFFKVGFQRLCVVYDELDLPAGRIQIRKGGSAAGHNGVSDIITHLGTRDFFRLRLGIAPGESAEGRKKSGKNWVLSQPGREDQELLEKAVAVSIEAIEILILEGLEKAQQFGNRRLQ